MPISRLTGRAWMSDGAITQTVRALLAILLAAGVAYHPTLDAAISKIYAALLTSPLFRHDTFEPMLAAACFTAFISCFYLIDLHLPCCRRWRIRVDEDDMSHYKVEGSGRAWEMLWYLGPLAVMDALFPRRAARLVEQPPTAAALTCDVLLSLLLYDALFFALHAALHASPALYKHVHAKHHSKAVQRACESVRLTFIEEAADVTCSVIALNVTRAHPLSRAVYNVIIVYLITELHCGYAFPWAWQDVIPLGLCAGSRRHDAHHATGAHYYQKFFTYLDDLWGEVVQRKPVA